jgi:hypothetical protein
VCIFNQCSWSDILNYIDTVVYIAVDGVRYEYKMASVTYFGNSHFTLRVIVDNNHCFSMAGWKITWSGNINTTNIVFKRCRDKNASCNEPWVQLGFENSEKSVVSKKRNKKVLNQGKLSRYQEIPGSRVLGEHAGVSQGRETAQ